MIVHAVDLSRVQAVVSGARREIILAIPAKSCLGEREPELTAVSSVSRIGVRVYAFVSGASGGAVRARVADRLAKAGVHVSYTSHPIVRMAVIDRCVVVTARNRIDFSDGALVTQGSFEIPAPLRKLVQQRIPTEYTRPVQAGTVLELRERRVLQQLALGTTDEAAARELGMALRTYRRVVAGLLGRMKARSRFQAGAIAAQKQWIRCE